MDETTEKAAGAPDSDGPGAPAAPAPPRQTSGPLKWVVLAVLVLALCGLDQVTKQWAQDNLQQRPGRSIGLVGHNLALTYVRNPGAAWGFLSSPKYATFRRPFFITISLVAMAFILVIFYYLRPGQRLLMTALSLIMSGALGNFIDRIRYNYVIDFLDVRIPLPGGSTFYWPKFNVADIAITVGVFVLVLEMFIGNKGEPEAEEPDEELDDLDQDLDWEEDDALDEESGERGAESAERGARSGEHGAGSAEQKADEDAESSEDSESDEDSAADEDLKADEDSAADEDSKSDEDSATDEDSTAADEDSKPAPSRGK